MNLTPRLDRLGQNLLINGRHDVIQRSPNGAFNDLNGSNGYYYFDRFGCRGVNGITPAETTVRATRQSGGPLDSLYHVLLAPQAASTRVGYGVRIENIILAHLPVNQTLHFRCFVKRPVGASGSDTVVKIGYRVPTSLHSFFNFSDLYVVGTDLMQVTYNSLSDSQWVELKGSFNLTADMKSYGLQLALTVIDNNQDAATLVGNTIYTGGYSLTTSEPSEDHIPYSTGSALSDLLLCYRYCYQFTCQTGTEVVPVINRYTSASEVQLAGIVPVPLRVPPTTTLGGTRGTDWYLRAPDDTINTTGTFGAGVTRNNFCPLMGFSSGTFTSGLAYKITVATPNVGYVRYDAEL